MSRLLTRGTLLTACGVGIAGWLGGYAAAGSFAAGVVTGIFALVVDTYR